MLSKKAHLPLETAILLLAGTAMIIAGLLLFFIPSLNIPYYQNGIYGLLLVIFSLQTITMGKTPFGDAARSPLLVAAGLALAAVGITACFIPEFTRLPRGLLLVCLGPGSLLLFLRMCVDKTKLRTWLKLGGIFTSLAIVCAVVYLASILLAWIIFRQGIRPDFVTATVFLLNGLAVCVLTAVLRVVYRLYPEAERRPENDTQLSFDHTMLLFMGVFMVILGALLAPVSLGLLPFSPSAQLGLLVSIFAVQMMAAGQTPIGVFPRSRLIIILGLALAAPGIVSCIAPGILVAALTLLVGILNVAGGLITMLKAVAPLLKPIKLPDKQMLRMLLKLQAVQLLMGLLSIAFGTSMLIPNLVHGLVIGVVLALNGLVLMYLLSILIALDRRRQQQQTAPVA